MDVCTIDKMKKADIDAVYAIECECFITPWSKKSISGELKNDLAYYGVMRMGNEIIAYAGMWSIFDEAHITNVAVKKAYRGNGLGRALMNHMIEKALFRGAKRMTLEVREKNYVAQNLYKSLGFQLEGIRKRYYADTGEDGFIMWKDLI